MNRENDNLEREPMNCLKFREVLHELDRPGTRGAAAFDNAMAHAEVCGDCGVLVEEESLGFALQKIAQETTRMPGASRVEAELLKAFRQELKPASLETIPMRPGIRWGVIALGIAAAMLLVLGTVIYQRNLAKSARCSGRQCRDESVGEARRFSIGAITRIRCAKFKCKPDCCESGCSKCAHHDQTNFGCRRRRADWIRHRVRSVALRR